MTGERPIEPDAVVAADGTRLPDRRIPRPLAVSAGLVRAAPAVGVLGASVLAGVAAAVGRAAGMAARRSARTASPAAEESRGQWIAAHGTLEISWTRVEIRWRI